MKYYETKFIIGAQTVPQDFIGKVAKRFSLVTGGCKISLDQGFWVEGAEQTQETYTGKLITENAVCIETTVEASNDQHLARFLTDLKTIIAEEIGKYSVLDWSNERPTWIHCQYHEVITNHFEV